MAITKRNNYMIFVLITYILVLICRIFLFSVTGETGMTSFGIANELFWVLGGTFFYSIQEAVASLVKYRIRREQHKSAQKVFHGALIWGSVTGAVWMVLIGSASKIIASTLFHVSFATLAIQVAALAIPFTILAGVFRGLFLGNNMRAPLIHSAMIFAVIYGIAGMIGGSRLLLYGQNVASLLRSEEFQYVYSAVGASLGLLVASVCCLIYLLVLYFLFRSSLHKTTGRDIQKMQDSGQHIFHMLFGTGAFYALSFLIFYSPKLLEQLFYFSLYRSETSVHEYGDFYAKCDTLPYIAAAILLCFLYPFVRKVLYFMEREEYRMAREKLGTMLHKCTAASSFVTILVAVLSENILALFFKTNQAASTGELQLTAIASMILPFAFLFLCILVRMKKGRLVLLLGGGSLLIRLVLLIFLLSAFHMGIPAIAISRMAGNTFLTASSAFFVCRSIQYHHEWIRNAAIPVVAAALSGVIAMLLNQLLCKWMGKVVSLLICVGIAVLLDLIVLLVTRNFREDELNNSLVGRCVIRIGKGLNLF